MEKVELQIGIAVSAYNGTALQMGKKALLAVVCSLVEAVKPPCTFSKPGLSEIKLSLGHVWSSRYCSL